MAQLICIVCPKGCHLTVDENNGYKVTGNACKRGEEYGKKELLNPTRTVTSTVRIEHAMFPMLPVKTLNEIPKANIFKAMDVLNSVRVEAPVKVGDVVADDSAGSGAVFVATRSMEKYN